MLIYKITNLLFIMKNYTTIKFMNKYKIHYFIALGIIILFVHNPKLISESNNTQSQMVFNDSLDYELGKTKTDSMKIEILNLLVRKFLLSDSKKAFHYANQGLEISQASKNPYLIALSYNSFSLVNWATGKFSTALDYSFKSLRINDSLKNYKGMVKNYGNIGNVYSETKQYTKAIEYFDKALKIAEKYKMSADIAKTYGNIGIAYNELENNDKAMEYYNKATIISRKLNDTVGLIRLYSNIAVVYYFQKKLEEAIETNNIALELADKINDNRSKCLLFGNNGTTLMKIANDSTRIISESQKRQLLNEAIGYFNKAIKLSKEMNFQDSEMKYLNGLTMAYEDLGNYKLAFDNLNKFEQLEDSLFNIENQQIIADLESNYEKELKDKEISLLKKEQDLNKIYIFAAVLLIAAAIILLYVLHRSYITTKKFNTTLESKNIELSQTNATKDKLFTVLSHDIRNPLQTISLNSELLETFYEKMDDEERLQRISRIMETSSSLNNLFEELLQWARAQSNKIEYNPVEFKLKDLVDVVIKLHSESAALKNIIITNNIPAHCQTYADMSLVNTIIRNLISNSIKFSNTNGEITVSCDDVDKMVMCSVSDKGIGIAPENIPKLLSITSTFTTRGTNNESGTGLGLILVNEFVKVNKGDLDIQSTEGKGTTISFTLPKQIA